jgi:allantoinase
VSTNKNYLKYPHRSLGMDHSLYKWSMLDDRPPIQWPNGKKLALWINISLQFFPLNQQNKPFPVPGGMTMPYPDLRHYTLRDYGNRIGIYRFFDALDQYGMQSSIAMNTLVAKRYPYLLNKIIERGHEIICHGDHMDALHYGGQPIEEEAALVQKSLNELRQLSGQPVKGWISPAKNESHNTPQLLAANGIEYFCDWVNDDMPYEFYTDEGALTAMPLSTELEDKFILMNNLHSESSYKDQIIDACDFLLEEASTKGGRILALNLHPWLLGQPHRIHILEQVFEYLSSKKDIWSTNPMEIVRVFKS